MTAGARRARADHWAASLTPGEALCADLADRGLPDPLADGEAARWDAWMQMATVLDRLRTLPRRRRAAYARRSATVWRVAQAASGEERFAAVAGVVAAWPGNGEAPPLAGFRELLWGVEQIEAAGAVRLSLAGLAGLVGLVPAGDLRAGYAIAQEGRALRTLGALAEAERAFDVAGKVADAHADAWLACRCFLGQGALAHAVGNYPAARAAFHAVLGHPETAPELAQGAHHGLMNAAMAARDYRVVLVHGWAALRGVPTSAMSRAEVLTCLASVCQRLGRQRAALRAAQAALVLGVPVRRRATALCAALLASVALGEHATGRGYVGQAREEADHAPDPYDRADAYCDLADAYLAWADLPESLRHLERAETLITQFGFHELAWRAHALREQIEHTTSGHSDAVIQQGVPLVMHADEESVIEQLTHGLADLGRNPTAV